VYLFPLAPHRNLDAIFCFSCGLKKPSCWITLSLFLALIFISHRQQVPLGVHHNIVISSTVHMYHAHAHAHACSHTRAHTKTHTHTHTHTHTYKHTHTGTQARAKVYTHATTGAGLAAPVCFGDAALLQLQQAAQCCARVPLSGEALPNDLDGRQHRIPAGTLSWCYA